MQSIATPHCESVKQSVSASPTPHAWKSMARESSRTLSTFFILTPKPFTGAAFFSKTMICSEERCRFGWSKVSPEVERSYSFITTPALNRHRRSPSYAVLRPKQRKSPKDLWNSSSRSLRLQLHKITKVFFNLKIDTSSFLVQKRLKPFQVGTNLSGPVVIGIGLDQIRPG